MARQWAERKKAQAKRHLEDAGYFPREDTMAAIEHIMATTTEPTMADVEWDDEKHHLAGATLPSGYEVVMFWAEDDYIITDQESWSRDCLTPNGKQYELVEVTDRPEASDEQDQQPAHPEVLETVEDYENAPAGTVVATPQGSAWTQGPDGNWWQGAGWKTDSEMSGIKRQVLRYGWGE